MICDFVTISSYSVKANGLTALSSSIFYTSRLHIHTMIRNPTSPWCRTATIGKETEGCFMDTITHPTGECESFDLIDPSNRSESVDSKQSDGAWFRSVPQHELEAGNSVILGSYSYDLTISSDWMEYIERKEGRLNDYCGAGAYDTMRCDLQLTPFLPLSESQNSSVSQAKQKDPKAANGPFLKVWGEEFHLDRLRNSYMSIRDADASGYQGAEITVSTASINNPDEAVDSTIETAIQQSKIVINSLLSEAQSTIPSYFARDSMDMPSDRSSQNAEWIYLVKLTLLWSPLRRSETVIAKDEVVVRGHACCSCKPIRLDIPPRPIIVSVAVSHSDRVMSMSDSEAASIPHTSSKLKTESTGHPWEDAAASEWQQPRWANQPPNRLHNPQAKIASWCR